MMNLKAGLMWTLGCMIAKDIYEIVSEVAYRQVYKHYGDKIEAWRSEWYSETRHGNSDKIIGFRA